MKPYRSLLLVVFALLFAFSSVAPEPVFAAEKKTSTSKKSPAQTKALAKKALPKITAKKTASKANKKKTTAAKAKLKRQYSKTPPAPAADKFAAVVVDADTGHVLYEKNADATRYPASLTKMMTLYLTFDALKKGKFTLDKTLPVSQKAAAQPETNINLVEGDRLSVRDAIESLVVRSANDASVVLAEGLGQTEWNFALMMTQKARELGMKDTVFRNANGLPNDQQYTSAFDMARLGIALRRDFPEYFPFFKTERFDFRGVTYTTHNRVMLRYDGADGIKTGYIRASGFNLVTSVEKKGYHIVAVVMGGSSGNARDDLMIDLLDRTFAQLGTKSKNMVETQPANINQHAAMASGF